MNSKLIYYQIYESLKKDVANKIYKTGDKLPSENHLSKRFEVNRHTVRRALQILKNEGILFSKRGSGVIVQDSKFKYKIGKRVRFSQNITNENYIPKTKIIRSEIRKASKIEADNLKINSRDEILLIETTGKINNIPTILTKRTIPNKRFPRFLEIFQKELSVTHTLKLLGINDFVRLNTNIIAELADSIQANLLNCKINSPLLKTTYVNQDLNSIPIEYSQTWFVGERIQLTLED
ncbi:MAG: phosphonate metabolism transcriptional regulator PhnF [Candidatus Puniceispirillales bacterium]